MRHADRNVQSISELLTALRDVSVARETLWFRGHAQSAWSLVPSLARNAANLPKETEVIKRFIQLAVPHLSDDVPR